MTDCTASNNKLGNYAWPLVIHPSAMKKQAITCNVAIIDSCKSLGSTNTKDNLSEAKLVGDCEGFVNQSYAGGNTGDNINSKTSINIAGQATVSSSFVSNWATTSALNDGIDPESSNDRSGAVYGNWPKTGTQWVQYQFNKPFTISSCDVYWFKDGQGIDVPASYTIIYWDGQAWQYVPNAKGFGTEINKYNTTTFTPVTTNAIAIQMESNGSNSTGILEWKVSGK